MAFYSSRHYRSVSPAADTPADVADRLRRNEAAARARTERETRYPILNAENAQEAMDFQERRYQELYEAFQHDPDKNYRLDMKARELAGKGRR